MHGSPWKRVTPLPLISSKTAAASARFRNSLGTGACERRGSHPRWRCTHPNAIATIADEILFVGGSAIHPAPMANHEDVDHLLGVIHLVDDPIAPLADAMPLFAARELLAPRRSRIPSQSPNAPHNPLAFSLRRDRLDFLDRRSPNPNAILRHAALAASRRLRTGHSSLAPAPRKQPDPQRPRPDSPSQHRSPTPTSSSRSPRPSGAVLGGSRDRSTLLLASVLRS